MTRDEFDTEVQQLLKGEKKTEDKAVAYAIDKYRDARAEFGATAQKVEALKQQLQATQDKLLVLQGEVNSYATDLEHWLGVEKEKPDERKGKVTKGKGGVQVTDKREVV